MNHAGPSVIVNKTGFFTALVKGFFGTIIVLIICGTAVGLYGMSMAKNLTGLPEDLVDRMPEIIRALPNWQELPPVVADALNDHRDLDYADQLDVETDFVFSSGAEDRGLLKVKLTNNGDQAVSLAAVRVLFYDESTSFVDRPLYLATPMAMPSCHDGMCGPGPLPAGESRKMVLAIEKIVGDYEYSAEISDVRVWNGPLAGQGAQTAPRAVKQQQPQPKAPAQPVSPEPVDENDQGVTASVHLN